MEPYYTKQVIVIRKDLKMRKGKIAAQAAHASMKVFFDIMMELAPGEYTLSLPQAMSLWVNSSFAKICCYVESEEALDALYWQATNEGLPAAMIIDSGRTEFHGVPTKTCIAIGPWWSEEVDKITGNLKLL